jgi:5-formyltetrahydrofolate cyclo-ligase
MNKETIRKNILEKRDALSYRDVEIRSRRITDKLKEDKDYKKAKTIMLYMSKDKEVSVQELIKDAMENKKKVIVPKVTDKGLICCEVTDFKNMKYSCFGILEPTNEIVCEVTKIDLIVVPGIGFDKTGHRIGYGKGYYDNLLKNYKGKTIGVGYDFQIVDKIPSDKWDVKVDRVVSE